MWTISKMDMDKAMADGGILNTRARLSLDGIWSFAHESDGVWRQATVPAPWQAQFADLRHSSGRATYRREFTLPELAGRVAFLHFGAVSYGAEVSLNGEHIGQHDGGYLPFDLPIPAALLRPTNTVEVRCHLPDGSDGFAEIPHGKQSWYGPIGGIWQSVTLELRSPCHLQHCAIAADLATGQATARLTLSQPATPHLAILDPAGNVVAEGASPLTVPNVQPWSPDRPALYRLRVTLPDEVSEHTFGFRSIATKDGKILLNGRPFYMRAALDQDYYPVGICTPPSLEFIEDQLLKAKALGLNMLRCHIKVPDPRYCEVADRLGMLIWTEIPNVGILTEASARRLRDTMAGILVRDGNHPCIVIWTLINEDWGIRTCEDPAHCRWLKDTFDWLKALDPTRLVVDNSPCNGNFHVKTDLADYHYYRSVPERRAEWDALTQEFAARADWVWSPFGDAERRGDEPLLVSEFGVWGLPDPAQVTLDGAEPWWMETGAAWGDGAALPHGVQDRFAALQLGSVFGSFTDFIKSAQWYQFANLKYEIETMRAHPALQGYVITEFTDVHWESNGLLDMNRNPRVFHDQFSTINADVVILPGIAHYATWAGQDFAFPVEVASGGTALDACDLLWRSDDGASGRLTLPAIAALAKGVAGTIRLTPVASANRMMRIDFSLVEAGQTRATNSVEIAVYAARPILPRPSVSTRDPTVAAFAQALGYAVVPGPEADIVLARSLNAADIAAMQAGKRYVVFADGANKTQRNLRVDEGPREQPFIPIVDDTPGLPRYSDSLLPNITLIARHGTMWRGDWIAGFSWVRRQGPLAALPGGPLFDLSFDRVVPHHVMAGFKNWEFGGPVHAGIVVGWVRKPAALIAERRVGRGGLVASTFRLFNDAALVDPVATILFDALITLATNMAVEAIRGPDLHVEKGSSSPFSAPRAAASPLIVEAEQHITLHPGEQVGLSLDAAHAPVFGADGMAWLVR